MTELGYARPEWWAKQAAATPAPAPAVPPAPVWGVPMQAQRPPTAPQPQGALSAAAVPPAPAQTPAQTPAPGARSSWADPVTAAAQLPGMAGAMQQATTYSPSENALVSTNLTKLLAKDSPYMTLARTKAAQYANSRGLLNSSMAAGAGEGAAIESALPIAQQDASSYFTADRDNAGVLNAFSRDANEFGRAGALTAARAGMDMAAQRESQAFTTGRDTAQFGQRMKEIEFSTDQALRRYDAEQGSRLGDTYRDATTAIYDQYSQDATRINESDMDPAVKTAQLGELKSLHASRQTHLNTVFAEQPRWRQEWAQFALEFAETEGA